MESQKKKKIYLCFIDYTKVFDCVDHKKLWKILKEMGILYHLNCLLRNLYASRETTVLDIVQKTGSQLGNGKRVRQGFILSSCIFNLYAEYIMLNVRLDESQAGNKTAVRNMNNLRCAEDTTKMADTEQELKSLLLIVKEKSEKSGLKFNIQNTKIMASGPIM